MPIQLDKILADIAKEKVLHPNYQGATKSEIEHAWARVGKNSSLSVHESRSIFKVLQKKYEQEKLKGSTAWKLFGLLDQIHQKFEVKPQQKEDDANEPMEEDEEYEMLEVQEEEEGGAVHAGQSGDSGSDVESPNKSHNPTAAPEKVEKSANKPMGRPNATAGEKTNKVLNNMIGTQKSGFNTVSPQTPSATAAALQKKGITVKKTTGGPSPGNQQGRSAINQIKNIQGRNAAALHGLEVGKTIQLSESLKRKLSQDNSPSTPQTKKMNQQNTPQSASGPSPSANKSISPHTNAQHTTTAQLLQLKHERQDEQQQAANATNNSSTPPGINLITIPANPSANLVNGIITTSSIGGPPSSTAATVASTSTNGFSPRIEEIDFRNDIIFEANSNANGTPHNKAANPSEVINLGNFDNSLPPTFFKNLCNSSRHEALGLYVANVMNRLGSRSAAKLEVGILKAILDIQSDELEQ